MRKSAIKVLSYALNEKNCDTFIAKKGYLTANLYIYEKKKN